MKLSAMQMEVILYTIRMNGWQKREDMILLLAKQHVGFPECTETIEMAVKEIQDRL